MGVTGTADAGRIRQLTTRDGAVYGPANELV